jgi:hypothetical protein
VPSAARQWNEITLELDGLERRLKYDGLMGHAPRLSEAGLEQRLRDEGLRLEFHEREKSRMSVGNTLSDALGAPRCLHARLPLWRSVRAKRAKMPATAPAGIIARADSSRLARIAGTLLLLSGLHFNRARLAALRTGIAARFLSLEVSTQAFLLLLAADITVGYHSSDGWVTFVEVLVGRYNVGGAEGLPGAENAIRLFVAVVPVVIDVTFKYWVYKYLRKLSPGTQIILSEIERH